MSQNSDFRIVLLHDDLVSGMRGSSVLDQLAGQLEMEADELVTNVWNFEGLLQPKARVRAVSQIMEANMIIISAAGAADLPPHLKNWLENVMELRRDREAAIVALLDWEQSAGGKLPRLGVYLREMAAKAGLDFFCNKDNWPPRREVEIIPAISEIDFDFGALREVVPLVSGGRGWGIND